MNIKKLVILAIILTSCLSLRAQADISLPDSIFSGLQGQHHVQGVAVDKEHGHVYFSFTTRLVKTDLQGRMIGSVDGLTGHLGCLAFNPADRRVYASIEYKNDVIGQGISGDEAKSRANNFYIAAFDVDKITSPGMKPTADIVSRIHLPEVGEDYEAKVMNGGKEVDHRYGCSGIDGVAIAPLPGDKSGEKALYVAYGIYSDPSRTDNDYQVITAYDMNAMQKDKRKKVARYFVYTGNTNYGIQNMAYDADSNTILASVYKGKKSEFPNYDLFAISLDDKAKKMELSGFDSGEKGLVLPLREWGLSDDATGLYGWMFPYGPTGLCSVGDGFYYISHNQRYPEQCTTLHLYRWTGNPQSPFEMQ